jgi:hypothetical protein
MASVDWERVPLSQLLVHRDQRLKPEEAARQGLPMVEKISFADGRIHLREPKSRTGLIVAEPEDLIISGINVLKGAAAVNETGERVAATIHYSAYSINSKRVLPKFLVETLRSSTFRDAAITQMDAGVKTEVKPPRFLPLEIDLPPISKQLQIVDAIDAADSLLASATEEHRALGDLLRAAQEDAFASLDAETVKLNEIADVRTGSTPKRDNATYFGGDVPWVKTGDIRFRDLHKTQETLTDSGLDSCSARLLPEGSVVLAMIGQGATRGRSAVLGRPMATNQNAAGIIPSEKLEARYLFHWLWLNYERLRELGGGNSQPAMSGKIVSQLELPLASMAQQISIARQLDVIHQGLLVAEDARTSLTTLRASVAVAVLSGEWAALESLTAVHDLATAQP